MLQVTENDDWGVEENDEWGIEYFPDGMLVSEMTEEDEELLSNDPRWGIDAGPNWLTFGDRRTFTISEADLEMLGNPTNLNMFYFPETGCIQITRATEEKANIHLGSSFYRANFLKRKHHPEEDFGPEITFSPELDPYLLKLGFEKGKSYQVPGAVLPVVVDGRVIPGLCFYLSDAYRY